MKKAALIGDPVSHSLSPELHIFWCGKYSIPATYEAIKLDHKDLDDFLEKIREGEFVGANVTIPFKEAVVSRMDRLAISAARTGAVNIIVRSESGGLEGHNSDPEGFLQNLDHTCPGLDCDGMTAMVLGTGGAARACIFALLERGVKDILIVGRTPGRVQEILKHFSSTRLSGVSWSERNLYANKVSLLVNATPLGMAGTGSIQFDFENMEPSSVVYDLVYGGQQTAFLGAAKSAGLKTVDGLGMLIFQAIPAFEAWFGKRPAYSQDIYDRLAGKAG